MRFLYIALLGLCLILTPAPAVAAGTGSATEAVKKTITEALNVVQDKNLKPSERAKERRRQLVAVIGTRFDYQEMAIRSLGGHWRKLGDPEKQEFVRLFTFLLVNAYADKIEGYSGEQIQYVNERIKNNYAEVKTKIVSGKSEFPLDYRLRNQGEGWRVYDVVVDGVSLVRNYRGQFSKIIRSSSYQDLVKKLREKSELGSAP